MKAFFGFVTAVAMGAAVLLPCGLPPAGFAREAGQGPRRPAPSTPNPSQPSEAKMSVQKESFGKTADGAAVDLYTLTNSKGLRVKIMTYGATIISVETPDRNGKLRTSRCRSTSPRVPRRASLLRLDVGRFANRIAKGKFTLDGKQYTLAGNNNGNHLHGGNKGFDK